MNKKEQTLELKKVVKARIPEANIAVAQTELIIATISFAIRVLIEITSLDANTLIMNWALIYLPIVMLIISTYCLLKNGQKSWLRFALLALLGCYFLLVELMMGFRAKVTLLLPIMIAMHYYDKNLSFFVFLTTLFLLFLSVLANAYLYQEIGFIDLGVTSFKETTILTVNGNLIDEVIKATPNENSLLERGLILTFLPNFVVISLAYITANRMMDKTRNILLQLNEETAKEKEKEAELIDAKTKVILSQVKPHFIYNTLTSIAYLCGKDPNKAKELTLDFSAYLRSNLDHIAEDSLNLIPFNDELEHVKNYLNIELMRFADKLKVEYDIKVTDFKLPSLTIQPLVENAVKHGICKKEEGGTLKISTKKTSESYQVFIKDDGIGFDLKKVENDDKVHVGIDNTRERLMLCGGTLNIKSRKGKGTTIIVSLPVAKET